MNVLIVYAHPEPGSFNSALHRVAVETLCSEGHEVIVSNLYQMDFQPVASSKDFIKAHNDKHPRFRREQEKAFQKGYLAPDISREQDKLKWCDLLVLQFPLWWFSMPAILKGWVDRVMTPGFAYSRTMIYNHGGLRGKKAMILLTTGGSQLDFSEKGLNGPINLVLFPIQHGILHYVGFDVVPPFIAWHPSGMQKEQRKNVLNDLSAYLGRIDSLEPLRFPVVEDIDKGEGLRAGLDWATILNLTVED